MKTALIIAYILIAILAIVVFMEWKFIQALTPAAPTNNAGGSSGSGGSADTTTHRSAADQGDGSATFGSMIDAVKEGAKEMELKVTFNN